MKCSIFLLFFLLINNPLLGAEFFTSLNTQKREFEFFIHGLPIEIRKNIYFKALDNLKKYNQETIKRCMIGSLKISDYYNYWHDVQHYFSFKNYGSQCTHIIAFYPKEDGPNDHGMESTPFGNKTIGAFAIACIHTLKDKDINTVDCLKKDKQTEAPAIYNEIKLYEKNEDGSIG